MINGCTLLVVLSVILTTLTASAQDRPELPSVVVLGLSAPADQMVAFEQGLHDLGQVDGSTVLIKHLSAQGREDRLAELAQQAVGLSPKVIAAIGSKAGRAAQQATKDIPIVVVTGSMSVAGLVKNLARPEGNVTGLSFFNVDLRLKQFEILLELAPRIRRLRVLVSGQPTLTGQKALALLTSIAKKQGVTITAVSVDDVEGLKSELSKVRASSEEGLLILASPVFDARPAEIGRFTVERRLIAMLPWKQYVQAGGLVSYSPDIIAIWGRASSYVDRILRGAKPSDLPVEQPTQFELVINLETAEALSLTVPATLLLRADKVIE